MNIQKNNNLIEGRKKIIIVGTGEHYKNILSPSLDIMKKEGSFELLTTVSKESPADLKKTKSFRKVEHRIRKRSEKLSSLLSDFKNQNPVVILSHINELHTPDAYDLVKNGFKVMIEKPYCLNRSQFEVMRNLINRHPDKIGLLEYYLMMKSIPLLILAGMVKKDSFYFKKEGLLKIHKGLYSFVNNVDELSGRIKEFIGTPKFILVDVLEGEGNVGRLDHRGAFLCDRRKGGGMIQDLGIHALSPLFALEDYIGNIGSFKKGNMRIAKCKEYVDMAKRKFGLSDKYLGETYAEIEFSTSKGVQVMVSVGKYVLNNKNQRRIVIVGSEGRVYFDLSSCTLFVSTGENSEMKILEIPKKPGCKYYSVLKAALEVLEGHNPFSFNATLAALRTQSFILNILEKAYFKNNKIRVYKAKALPQNIDTRPI
ncbi:hypothetical protein KJA13_00630 [Patescibacteria group bacterium]|nr:hypothetical protein [Patescibacteria group bacterium]